MRVSYTLLALAALVLVAACGTNSSEIVAPGTNSANSTVMGEGGAGLIGSGNAIATDTTAHSAERGGAGLIGSGN